MNAISIITDEIKEQVKDVTDKIFSNPELGFEEKKAVAWQVELLEKHGFNVEVPAGKLDTAFKASFGNEGPSFCFMSEYDALPDIGHACGHNLIAGGALAAGITFKNILKKDNIPGRIVIMGCPAEEGKGGKLPLIKENAFAGIDAALICHPYNKTLTECGWLSVSRFNVSFRGKPAHASVSPWEGQNALDAAMLLFSGVNAWRQQLPEASRVHGIINKGGSAPNIIPDYSECFFYVRADNEKTHSMMEERFRRIAEGAALMTDTSVECKRFDNAYASALYNRPLDEEYYKLANDAGLNPIMAERRGRGSSDFANVSQILPCINLFYGIADKDISLHSVEFRDAAGSAHGFEQTMKTAGIMIDIAFRYITDKSFKEAVDQDFQKRIEADGVA